MRHLLRGLLVAVALVSSLVAGQSLAAQDTSGAPPWLVTPEAPLTRAEIVVGDTTLDVELALEGWQQQLGLGYRNGLEPSTGMLFPSRTSGPGSRSARRHGRRTGALVDPCSER